MGIEDSSSESESESESEESESLSESLSGSGGSTIPLYIAHAIEIKYAINVRTKSPPPNRPSGSKNRMKTVKNVVRPSRTAVYIFAELSNVMLEGEKMRPREKAPNIFDILLPRMLPKASGDWC